MCMFVCLFELENVICIEEKKFTPMCARIQQIEIREKLYPTARLVDHYLSGHLHSRAIDD